MADGVLGYAAGQFLTMEVWSEHEPPRMPGDGCGCQRRRENGRWVLKLCDRHVREPGIARYCLDR